MMETTNCYDHLARVGARSPPLFGSFCRNPKRYLRTVLNETLCFERNVNVRSAYLKQLCRPRKRTPTYWKRFRVPTKVTALHARCMILFRNFNAEESMAHVQV